MFWPKHPEYPNHQQFERHVTVIMDVQSAAPDKPEVLDASNANANVHDTEAKPTVRVVDVVGVVDVVDVVEMLDLSNDAGLQHVARIIKWLRYLDEPSEAQMKSTQCLYDELKRLVVLIHRKGYCDHYSQWGQYLSGDVDTALEALKEAKQLCGNDDEEEAILKRLYEEGVDDVDDDMHEVMDALTKSDVHPYMKLATVVITQLLEQKKPRFATNAVRLFDALTVLVDTIVYDEEERGPSWVWGERVTSIPKYVMDGAKTALKEAQRCGNGTLDDRIYDF